MNGEAFCIFNFFFFFFVTPRNLSGENRAGRCVSNYPLSRPGEKDEDCHNDSYTNPTKYHKKISTYFLPPNPAGNFIIHPLTT